jgi:hypothetical protein
VVEQTLLKTGRGRPDRACHTSAYNQRVTDNSWMLWNNKPSPPSHPPREEVFGFAMVKDVRVMTGALRRVDDERWEVIYRADASLYSAQVVGSRDDDDSSSEHDGHIRDIENAGPQWANPNVHEVDDLSIGDAIEEVGRPTSYEQSHSE